MSKPELHLFDFDGTITARDSLLDFAEFVVGPFRSKVYLALVTPGITLMKMGLLKRANAKVMFLKLHFKGRQIADLKNLANDYASKANANGLFRNNALESIKELKRAGHEVCIVSASLDIWLEAFSELLEVELICTIGEINDGKFTGELVGKNCNFNEKARRIQSNYELEQFSKIVAYGDSSGDKAMFELADESHLDHFK